MKTTPIPWQKYISLVILEKDNIESLAAGAKEAFPRSSNHVPSKSREHHLFDPVNRKQRRSLQEQCEGMCQGMQRAA